MTRLALLAAIAALSLAGCGEAPTAQNEGSANGATPAPAPHGDIVRVTLTTDLGDIILALDARHAPVTVENFLAYVDQHRFDGTIFYRASRTPHDPHHGFVQGGIQHVYTRMLPPIRLEPTSQTGLLHRDGTISMARTTRDSAMGDFVICVGAQPAMDAGPRAPDDHLGYASFGQVVGGMDIVRRILAAPTDPNQGSGDMRGEMLAPAIHILSAHRTA